MKTLIVSLAALVAVSGAALASDRSGGLRDSDTYFGKYSTNSRLQNNAMNSSALLILKSGKKKMTAFERMMQTSEDHQHNDSVQEHKSRGPKA